jgi:hypothetical protein
MSPSGGPPGARDGSTPAPCHSRRAVARRASLPRGSGRHQLLLTRRRLRARVVRRQGACGVFHVKRSSTAFHSPVGPTAPAGPAPRCGAQVTRTGDPGRLVDELSPAMCTGWGDLSSSAHPSSRPSRRVPSSPAPVDDGRRRPDLHVHPVGGGRTPATAVQWVHTWVRTGDGRWGNRGTGRGETAGHVRNRRDVHVSTQECACPPTVGQHVDSGADLRERPRSPGSTPVMTEMREIDQGFSNHIQGGDAALRVT